MGYPMTITRVIHRNQLSDGDYDKSPLHRYYFKPVWDERFQDEKLLLDVIAGLTKTVNDVNSAFRMLAGDLRRLERDVLDEDAICKLIAQRTNVDPDSVAAVLKEFMSI